MTDDARRGHRQSQRSSVLEGVLRSAETRKTEHRDDVRARVVAAELRAHAACECPLRWRMEVLDPHGDAISSQEDWFWVIRRRVA